MGEKRRFHYSGVETRECSRDILWSVLWRTSSLQRARVCITHHPPPLPQRCYVRWTLTRKRGGGGFVLGLRQQVRAPATLSSRRMEGRAFLERWGKCANVNDSFAFSRCFDLDGDGETAIHSWRIPLLENFCTAVFFLPSHPSFSFSLLYIKAMERENNILIREKHEIESFAGNFCIQVKWSSCEFIKMYLTNCTLFYFTSARFETNFYNDGASVSMR